MVIRHIDRSTDRQLRKQMQLKIYIFTDVLIDNPIDSSRQADKYTYK